MLQKLLFIDRDGTVIVEPPDHQVDSLEKFRMMSGAAEALSRIARNLDYTLVMVTNQDGLGTASFPEEQFWPAQNKMVEILQGEGVVFSEILIDRSVPHENAHTRKPRTGLLTRYLKGDYDLKGSYVIGDRVTDMELAKNLGARGIFLKRGAGSPSLEEISRGGLEGTIACVASGWPEILDYLEKNR